MADSGAEARDAVLQKVKEGVDILKLAPSANGGVIGTDKLKELAEAYSLVTFGTK
jgi:hypothetical protein